MISSIQRFAVYLFCFSLNFEDINLFGLGIDYLASKTTIVFLIVLSMFKINKTYSLKYSYKYLIPLFSFFFLFTMMNYFNQSGSQNNYFYIPLFLNILVLINIINISRFNNLIIIKGLLAFAFGSFLLSVFHYIGFDSQSSYHHLNRETIFGMNQNKVGIYLCIASLSIILIVIENYFKAGKSRYFLLLTLPTMIGFMVKTGSRVSIISFILGILIFIFKVKTWSGKRLDSRKIILTFGIVVFLIFILQGSFIIERIADTIYKGDLSARDLIWLQVISIISDNLWWGIGMTGYNSEMMHSFAGMASPHNAILETLAYTGIVGFFILSIFFYRVIQSGFKVSKNKLTSLPIILLAPLLGNLLSAQIFNQKIFWVIMAFIISSGINLIYICRQKALKGYIY